VSRLAPGVTLRSLVLDGTEIPEGRALEPNHPVLETRALRPAADAKPTEPCWLGAGQAPPSPLAGLPEAPAPYRATFRLEARGVPFEITVPVQYRFRDPVRGERYQPFVVNPAVLVDLPGPVEILGDASPRPLRVRVSSGGGPVAGRIRLEAPPGWRVEPADLPFDLARAGEEAELRTTLTPPEAPSDGHLEVKVETPAGTFPARSRVRIDPPHIPLQTLFPPCGARVVRLDLKGAGGRIGYVMGPGDDIPDALRPLGYQVDLLTDEALAGDLSVYDAVVVGIRAFNTRPGLVRLKDRLLDYVARGGTEVVLYTVDQGRVVQDLGPYPFKVSRDRVTDETARVTFLAPSHPVLTTPNRITQADFDGWVQERGLYFARDWDPRYEPILSMADKGEAQLSGSLLVASHGRGHFVYTGLAFFRQLPDGVPGAYRLFANLLALRAGR
jgi:hypothetical protein